jgi:hypothetical protein
MKKVLSNPPKSPFAKGDFNSPLRKRGVGRDFHTLRVPTPGMRV